MVAFVEYAVMLKFALTDQGKYISWWQSDWLSLDEHKEDKEQKNGFYKKDSKRGGGECYVHHTFLIEKN